MTRFLIALQFLTAFPIKIKKDLKDEDFGKSLLYFPLIGLFIGLLLSLVPIIFCSLSNLIVGALILIVSFIITGGIHLDGFADTCDGFYGNRSKEEILKIMRDSHIGAIGAIGVAMLLLLKFALIVSIPQNALWKSLVLMAVFGRFTQGLACAISKYARIDGKAKSFVENAAWKETTIGGVFTVIIFLLLAEFNGILLFIIAFILSTLFINYANKKLGGITGDVIGAANEIAEIAILFFIVLLTKTSF